MATETEELKLIASQIRANILQVTLKPKPSYSVDGQSFSWESYLNSLMTQLAAINSLIQQSEGPFEFESEGCTGGF